MTLAPRPDDTWLRPIDVQPISDQEFGLFQALVYREAGIYLSPIKKALLVGRLTRRLRERGLTTFLQYYRHVTEVDPDELVQMLDCISTNETHFFREPQHFEFLDQQVFPAWRAAGSSGLRPKRVRVWSAACSTGEEPYSLAMCLLSHFPPEAGWQSEIVATDLSTRVLAQAREGLWPIAKADEIPEHYLKRFMLKGKRAHEGQMKAGPEIQSLIRFQRLNLNDEAYAIGGRFDLVFCRNVLIYFDLASKTKVIHRLLRFLDPEGYLFVGHAESLTGMSTEVRCVMPNIYVHAGARSALGAWSRKDGGSAR